MKVNNIVVRNIMLKRGMNVKAFAEKAGMTPSVISNIINHSKERQYKTIVSLAQALNVDPQCIILDDTAHLA